jgi:hypothetical protein
VSCWPLTHRLLNWTRNGILGLKLSFWWWDNVGMFITGPFLSPACCCICHASSPVVKRSSPWSWSKLKVQGRQRLIFGTPFMPDYRAITYFETNFDL